jgi:hypothetical protein
VDKVVVITYHGNTSSARAAFSLPNQDHFSNFLSHIKNERKTGGRKEGRKERRREEGRKKEKRNCISI